MCFLKNCLFSYIFSKLSAKKFSSICICLSAMLWKLLSTKEGEIRFFFFPGKSVFYQYFRTLSENLDAVWQFTKAISSKLLFTFPVQHFCQESFFLWDSISHHFGTFSEKKIEFLVEIFWRFTMFFATSAKFFSMSPEEFLRKIFPIQWVFPFCKTERWKFGSLAHFSGRIVKPAL